MTASTLKAKFERLGPTRVADRALSGSREVVTLRAPADLRDIDTIAPMLVLRRAGLSVLRAKRVIETVLANGVATVELPSVADVRSFERSLTAIGFSARIRLRDAPGVQTLRETLGLTQEQFAIRFGLDVDAIRNWEHGRRAPDTAARALLKAIAHCPDMVAEAQDL